MTQTLHEELWADDPWRVLAICIMLNCTSPDKVKPIAIEFFKRWPTPKLCRIGKAEEQAVLLAPLGFVSQKADRIREAARAYIMWTTYGGKPESFEVEKVKGCGKFAREAWNFVVLRKWDGPLSNPDLERRRLQLIAEEEAYHGEARG